MTDPLEPRAIIVTVLHPRLSSSKEEAPTSGKHGLLATVFTIPWTCCSSTWPGELRVSPYVKCDDERGIHYRGWQSTVKLARFPPPFHGRMNVSLLFPYSLLNNFCTRLPCSNVRDVRFVTRRNGPLFLRRYRIRTLDVARNYDDEIFHEVARSEMIRFLFFFSLSLSLGNWTSWLFLS